jgi:hypothetical protein
MKTFTKMMAAALTTAMSVSVQAHEGHAAVGSLAHSVEHAGWLAAGVMVVSVMTLLMFSVSATWADKVLHENKPSKPCRKKPH